jgi:hypothetical protein
VARLCLWDAACRRRNRHKAPHCRRASAFAPLRAATRGISKHCEFKHYAGRRLRVSSKTGLSITVTPPPVIMISGLRRSTKFPSHTAGKSTVSSRISLASESPAAYARPPLHD